MHDELRTALTELVQSEGGAFYGDADRVEARLHKRAADHPDDVTVLVTAVRAGVVTELLDVKPGLFDIAIGHLTSRMVRLYDTDPSASRWAVESWAAALGAAPATPAPPPAPPTAPAPEPEPAPEPAEQPAPAPTGRRLSIRWPWVAPVAAGVVGLIALVVLLRMISGLLASGSGDGGAARRPQATTAASSTTTAAAQAPALGVPPDLTLGTGDVQVTLLWADGNDLDLHVIDPSGAEIYFSNPKSASGGTLDHDDTAGCSSTGTHVENVFWPAGGAPSPRYRVFVKNYSSCGAPSRYSMRAVVRGKPVISVTGTVGQNEGDETPVSEFSF
jgi:hypothetical protein